MIRKEPRSGIGSKVKQPLKSLQDICCSAISINCERYPDCMLEELSQPCLGLLVQHFSMFDLLRLEQFLDKRGIDTKTAMYKLHRKIFQSNETYPLKATTTPHLLTLFPYDGLDWGLSRLLFRRTIAVLVEEYNNSTDEQYKSFQSATQEHIARRNECLMEMFCPSNGCLECEVSAKLSRLYSVVENLTVLAAKKVLYLTVDYRVLKFLLDKRFESILHSLYESVRVVSLVLKNSPLLMDFLKNMAQYGKKFERICIYGIKRNDLYFLDEILSLCSGVVEYGMTPQGSSHREALKQILISDDHEEPYNFLPRFEESHSTSTTETNPDTEYDLMDDAILFGTPYPSSKFDSMEGMHKADFKFTEFVKVEHYATVFNHHLRSWQALQELNIGIPKLHPDTAKCLCSMLQRPQFRSFTLSSATVPVSVMEDLLCAVASRRNCNPLEKLMFFDVHEYVKFFEDLFEMDMGTSQEEIARVFLENESSKLAHLQGFHGTRLLEISKSTHGAKMTVMFRQFVLKNLALETLCIDTNNSNVIMQSTLSSLAGTGQPLKCLILENWHILNDISSASLISLLHSVTSSLQSLNLSGCLQIESGTMFRGRDVVSFIGKILAETSVTELSLRRNAICKADVNSLLKSAAEIMKKRRPLDILDLRGNEFLEEDRSRTRALLEDISRQVLLM